MEKNRFIVKLTKSMQQFAKQKLSYYFFRNKKRGTAKVEEEEKKRRESNEIFIRRINEKNPTTLYVAHNLQLYNYIYIKHKIETTKPMRQCKMTCDFSFSLTTNKRAGMLAVSF